MPAQVVAKQPCYLRSEQGPAFRRYAECLYGAMINQCGTADMFQLHLIFVVLRLRPGSHLLEAGCGTGHTTRYLAERSQARFIGIDTAEPAIGRGQELAAADPERLTFKVGTMDALDFFPISSVSVIAIESLYFCKDLTSTVGQFQ